MTSRTISCWLASESSLQAASKASLIRPITSGSKNTPGRIGIASTSPTHASAVAIVLRARGQSYVDCTLSSCSRYALHTFASASWPSITNSRVSYLPGDRGRKAPLLLQPLVSNVGNPMHGSNVGVRLPGQVTTRPPMPQAAQAQRHARQEAAGAIGQVPSGLDDLA